MKTKQTTEERILELEGALTEAIDVFGRETHQIETSFPEYTAMQRMKRAVNKTDITNVKIRSALKISELQETIKELGNQL